MKRVRNLLLFTLFIAIFSLTGCMERKKSIEGILMKTDTEFSEMSAKEGMYKAFLHYMSDDGVMLSDNSKPFKGKAALADLFATGSDSSLNLEWKPLFELIGSGGDLGYTWGEYTRTIKPTGEVMRGNYVTIWRLQDDGTWKFVLDTGTEGLPD